MRIKKIFINYSQFTAQTILKWKNFQKKTYSEFLAEASYLSSMDSEKVKNWLRDVFEEGKINNSKKAKSIEQLYTFLKQVPVFKNEPIKIKNEHIWHIAEKDKSILKYKNIWLCKDCLYNINDTTFADDEQKLLILEFVAKEEGKITRLRNKFSGSNHEDKKRLRISENVRREVWRRDQGKCAHCGSRENLEYDHIVPVAKGGGNTARNIELLCQKCNRLKGDRIE